MPHIRLPFLMLLACTLGCADGSASPSPAPRANSASVEGEQHAPNPVMRVDSILAMKTMIARFQAELPPVTRLGHGAAASMDELVGRFGAAVSDSSLADLRALTMNVSEFAYLFFPTSIFASEPYAQPPAVNWLLLEQNSLKGQARLMRAYGGKRIVVGGYRCASEPRIEGENRILEHCVVRLETDTGDVREVRLFGSIIERHGRFKIMSLANRL